MSGNFRAWWHDYHEKCIYHVTLRKNSSLIPFGQLAGDCRLPVGTYGSPFIAASSLGRAVKDCLRKFPHIHPALSIFQYALMPDHLHLIVNVAYRMQDELGTQIGRFKNIVNEHVGMPGVFEPDFNDQILKANRNLNVIYDYLRSNPYRLAVRFQNPDYFQRINEFEINGVSCQLYGNIQLLDNPFKEQVVVHRRDDERVYAMNRDIWLHTVSNGGVLVSPFISEREKAIRDAAEEMGGRLIIVTNKPFADREKAAGKYFELCAKGNMLIVAPQQALDFSRAACLKMNQLAADIANLCSH